MPHVMGLRSIGCGKEISMGSVGSAVTKKSILYNGIHIEGTPANQKKSR